VQKKIDMAIGNHLDAHVMGALFVLIYPMPRRAYGDFFLQGDMNF
jgi:hypothetical protein